MKTFFLFTLLVLGASAHDTTDSCNVSDAVEKGSIIDEELQSISGMASSRISGNLAWVVNDASGSDSNDAYVYAINPNDGSIYATVKVLMEKDGDAVQVFDVKDLAVDKDGETSYVYIGDIGLNSQDRDNFFVHRFPEPTMEQIEADEDGVLEIVVDTSFELEKDSEFVEYETLMVDPKDKTVYLIARSLAGPADVRSFPTEEETEPKGETVTTMDIAGTIAFNDIVAGEISTDNRILLKSTQQTFLFFREGSEKIIDVLTSTNVCFMTEAEELVNDSGITFSKDLTKFFTVGGAFKPEAATPEPAEPTEPAETTEPSVSTAAPKSGPTVSIPGKPVPVDPFSKSVVYEFTFQASSIETEAPQTDAAGQVGVVGLAAALVAVAMTRMMA